MLYVAVALNVFAVYLRVFSITTHLVLPAHTRTHRAAWTGVTVLLCVLCVLNCAGSWACLCVATRVSERLSERVVVYFCVFSVTTHVVLASRPHTRA